MIKHVIWWSLCKARPYFFFFFCDEYGRGKKLKVECYFWGWFRTPAPVVWCLSLFREVLFAIPRYLWRKYKTYKAMCEGKWKLFAKIEFHYSHRESLWIIVNLHEKMFSLIWFCIVLFTKEEPILVCQNDWEFLY